MVWEGGYPSGRRGRREGCIVLEEGVERWMVIARVV